MVSWSLLMRVGIMDPENAVPHGFWSHHTLQVLATDLLLTLVCLVALKLDP